MENKTFVLLGGNHTYRIAVVVIFLSFISGIPSSYGFSIGFYDFSCPVAEFIVRSTVRSAASNDATVPGKLLRLLFHDCFVEATPNHFGLRPHVAVVLLDGAQHVTPDRTCTAVHFRVYTKKQHLAQNSCLNSDTLQCGNTCSRVRGCDASVLLEGRGTEKDDPANASLGGFEILETAKREIEIFCPGIVSCADILAMAARDAVALTGGPDILIPAGRRDGTVSAVSNVRSNIIDTSFTVNDTMKIFSSKGLSLEDLVILSGSHTIGSAHCSVFNDRFQINSKGNLTFVDSTLDKGYAMTLAKKCSKSASATVSIDPQTSLSFDNQYYNNLVAHRGLFQSDSTLFADSRTRNLVEQFARDLNSFYDGWSQSFIKMSSIGIKSDGEGEVRQTCSRING